jgi:hypothetical protein
MQRFGKSVCLSQLLLLRNELHTVPFFASLRPCAFALSFSLRLCVFVLLSPSKVEGPKSLGVISTSATLLVQNSDWADILNLYTLIKSG